MQAQKQAVRSELDSATKARDALRMQIRGMKGKMEYTSVEKIDEAMAKLEQKLQHTSMPLSEEKKVLDDIKKMRASRVSCSFCRQTQCGGVRSFVPSPRALQLLPTAPVRQLPLALFAACLCTCKADAKPM